MCLFERSSSGEGPRLVSGIRVNVSENTAMDFAQLTMALSKAFPSIRNKNDLEIKFYSSQQRRDQEPTDSIYELLKLHKQLGLGMLEEALVDHIFVRLEPQVQDYERFEIRKTRFNYWRCYLSLGKDVHVKQCGVRGIVIMLKDGVGMSVGCLMLMIVGKIGGA
ncbi:uncharacterized protein TNCV_641821 [Trichonephila clavipes]|nr:uncharacterized protein TNCV_641821 [Trichonephila clavipes]